ncbi:MAG: hypothetical protein ACOC2K_01465 [Bacteroidota bacterium]
MAQVAVFPQALFLDTKSRAANLKIINNNSDTREVTIEMVFGYPGYDSTGTLEIFMGDTVPGVERSAIPYVKVFPKKLMLNGGEEQVVKFMLLNTAKMEDGTYFGRIVVRSKEPPAQIDTTNLGGIKAQLDIEYNVVSALIVQKGNKDCKVEITDMDAYSDSASVNILVGFKRLGNSPFFGTAELNIYDADGNHVASKKEITPIYFDGKKAFKLDKTEFKEDKYKVEINLSNEHEDVPKEFKIPFNGLKESYVIDLHGKL